MVLHSKPLSFYLLGCGTRTIGGKQTFNAPVDLY
jgi:hypothetical protein